MSKPDIIHIMSGLKFKIVGKVRRNAHFGRANAHPPGCLKKAMSEGAFVLPFFQGKRKSTQNANISMNFFLFLS